MENIYSSKIFILAAGEQVRFPENYTPKQLLSIDGEIVLERQKRQLKEYNVNPVVLTKKEQIISFCKDNKIAFYVPENNNTVLNTILSSKIFWNNKRIIFLLGDVFYSKELIKSIIEDKSDIRFWMSGSEIFAFSFMSDKFGNQIENDINFILEHKKYVYKIWQLYRKTINVPLYKHFIKEGQEIVSDYTFDIDSEVQYHDVCKYVKKLKESGVKI